MLHSIVATLEELKPLLPLIPRALAILDPGAAARRFIMPGRKGARADVS
jgi:hypothetical protein